MISLLDSFDLIGPSQGVPNPQLKQLLLEEMEDVNAANEDYMIDLLIGFGKKMQVIVIMTVNYNSGDFNYNSDCLDSIPSNIESVITIDTTKMFFFP